MFQAFFISLEGSIKLDAKFTSVNTEKDKFFRSPINDELQIWETESSLNWQFRLVRFFKAGSIRAVACAYTNSTTVINQEDVDKLIGSAFRGALFDFTARSKLIWINGEIGDETTQIASQFLRNSNSLTQDAFATINKVSFVADGRGVALIDRSWDSSERAKRLQLVIALACAYQAALHDAIEELANTASTHSSQTEIKLRQWVKFLSAYYFDEPIKTSTIELIHFYEKIRERQRIKVQYEEVTNQLKLLAELVRLDRTEQIQKQTAKSTWRITAIGVAISLIGLLFTFSQVTPKTLRESTQAWASCINNSWASCYGSDVDKTTKKIHAPVKINK